MSHIVESDDDVPNIKIAITHLRNSLEKCFWCINVTFIYRFYVHIKKTTTVMVFFAVGLKIIYSNKSFNESVIESLLVNLKLFDLVSVTFYAVNAFKYKTTDFRLYRGFKRFSYGFFLLK